MPENASSCGALFCDFPVVARPACGFVWPSSGGVPMAFMCETSGLDGTCRSCPPGWTASGAFCVECDPLKSCDRNGTALCSGACEPRRYPTCDSATGRVSCQACSVDEAALAAGRRSLTRGGVLDAPDLCAAYFECYVGFYLTSNPLTGVLSCQACVYPESTQTGKVFLSRGLTFGDKYSCLYANSRSPLANNSAGEYGSPLRSCPAGETSEAGMAAAESDCVDCPSAPEFGGFQPGSTLCQPACSPGYGLRGDACVLSDPAAVDCDLDGYAVQPGGGCAPSPLPWSSPGAQATGGVAVSLQARATPLAALDADGDFRVVRSTGLLARQGVADFCGSLTAAIENKGYVQDKPLFAQACNQREQHRFYHVVSSAKFIYAFLERSFGNNNRFVMWQVLKQTSGSLNAGQVMQTYRLPAKVCSAVVAPGEFLYLAFCGSSFLSFVRQLDYTQPFTLDGTQYDNPPFTLDGTQYVMGRRVGLLIGQETSGNRDGMRDQALFKGPLSIAAASQNATRLWVADFGNCRVAEVLVPSPGSFLTRATTVGAAACFSGSFPLPYPRSIVSVLAGAAALFVTDRGLVQLDARMREFTLVMTSDELGAAVAEPLWIRAELSGERLLLENETHSAAVARVQLPCLFGARARRGGACEPCLTGTFSDGLRCLPCSSPACPLGQGLAECTGSADAYCYPCNASAPYPFRYGDRCQVIPLFPCPAGFYGLDDCFPCDAVSFRRWPPHAYCQCLPGLNYTANRTCAVPFPPSPAPPWLAPLRCDYELDANCTDVGCYLASVEPRSCVPCPPGTFTADSLACGACPGFRAPSPARDSCVCRDPTYASPDGAACVCQPGFSAGGPGGCAPCAPGTVRAESTVLPDDYEPFREGSCSFCPPGQEPAPQRTSCVGCGLGLYREGAMTACGRCAVGVAYAADPTRASSCTPCSAQCALGQRWRPCPVNATYFACSACPRLPRHREYVQGGRSCEWKCAAGFYEYNGDCFPCTAPKCGLGYRLTQCSRYEDAHCRLPCRDSAKPDEHSEWTANCKWKCEAGYVERLKHYPGWVEYACVEPEDFPWSLGV